MRLLLAGGSVIDWHRLAFSDDIEVDRFLRVNEFDPERHEDMERLEALREEAVEYLTRNFGYRIPDAVAQGMPARELFLLASSKGRRQVYACMVLKAMHVLHHLAGRELLFKLPVSDDEVFGFVEAKVVKVVEEIRAAGYPIVEFAWSRKERDSLITKLLAKKASIAAHVYDKLRFRLITRSAEDLPPVLNELLHRLVPFNYVIPGESVNGIVPFRSLVDEHPSLARYSDQLQQPLDAEDRVARRFFQRVLRAQLPRHQLRHRSAGARRPAPHARPRRRGRAGLGHLRLDRISSDGRRDRAQERRGRELPPGLQGATAGARQSASLRQRPLAADRYPQRRQRRRRLTRSPH